LSLYRAALRARRSTAALHDAGLSWVDAGAGVLAFDRGPAFRCLVNFGPEPVALPAGSRVLLASEPCDGALPPDTATWVQLGG
jgi:alpha-glucosidase